MKSRKTFTRIWTAWMPFVFLLLLACPAFPEEERQVVIFTHPEAERPKLAVWVPDLSETLGGRYSQSSERIGVAQGLMESELSDAGFRLANLSVPAGEAGQVTSDQALEAARASGADYLIFGRAIASQVLATESGSVSGGTMESRPGGRDRGEWGQVNRTAQSAAASAQVIRVEDGQVLSAFSGSSTGSVESQRDGIQGAYREATRRLLRQLIPALEDIHRDSLDRAERKVIGLD